MSQHARTRPGGLLGGRFEIERVVGEGGMGTVYAARNTKTGATVALKVIHEGAAGKPDSIRRFFREAKAATAIDHPNVVRVLDAFVDESGAPVMVMELLQGETLAAFRKARSKLEVAEVATIMLPVVSALREAHLRGIVHRDMKPENVFLARGHHGEIVPKVLDFGLAKARDAEVLRTESGHTKTGTLMGTPAYMSLEQAMGETDLDQRADVWSIGVMVFELLVGRRPFDVDTIGQMYRQLLTGNVPSIRDEAPGLPDDLATAIDHCLRKERDERAESLDELQSVLSLHATGGPIGVQSAGQNRRRRLVLGVVVFALAVAGAIVLALRHDPAASIESAAPEVETPEAPSHQPDTPPSAVAIVPPASAPSAPPTSRRAIVRSGGKHLAPVAPPVASTVAPPAPSGGLISVDNPHAPRSP